MSVSVKNKGTFDYFFIKFYQSLCVFAFKYLKSNEDCEEVVQSVFLKLYEKNISLDGEDELRLFLYKSVYNACLNFLRTKTRQEARDKEYTRKLSNEVPPPIGDIFRSELMAIIQNELTHIPKLQADVIRLCYFEELSNEEVAQRLNLSVQTVKNYKNIGLKKMRSRFPKGSLGYLFIGYLIYLSF